jgi:hypothetical protein
MVYAEGGHYTPLLKRARDLWRELEAASGNELLTISGVVTVMDREHRMPRRIGPGRVLDRRLRAQRAVELPEHFRNVPAGREAAMAAFGLDRAGFA